MTTPINTVTPELNDFTGSEGRANPFANVGAAAQAIGEAGVAVKKAKDARDKASALAPIADKFEADVNAILIGDAAGLARRDIDIEYGESVDFKSDEVKKKASEYVAKYEKMLKSGQKEVVAQTLLNKRIAALNRATGNQYLTEIAGIARVFSPDKATLDASEHEAEFARAQQEAIKTKALDEGMAAMQGYGIPLTNMTPEKVAAFNMENGKTAMAAAATQKRIEALKADNTLSKEEQERQGNIVAYDGLPDFLTASTTRTFAVFNNPKSTPEEKAAAGVSFATAMATYQRNLGPLITQPGVKAMLDSHNALFAAHQSGDKEKLAYATNANAYYVAAAQNQIYKNNPDAPAYEAIVKILGPMASSYTFAGIMSNTGRNNPGFNPINLVLNMVDAANGKTVRKPTDFFSGAGDKKVAAKEGTDFLYELLSNQNPSPEAIQGGGYALATMYTDAVKSGNMEIVRNMMRGAVNENAKRFIQADTFKQQQPAVQEATTALSKRLSFTFMGEFDAARAQGLDVKLVATSDGIIHVTGMPTPQSLIDINAVSRFQESVWGSDRLTSAKQYAEVANARGK